MCRAHAPLRIPILSFLHTFSLKSTCVGGPHPLLTGPRPLREIATAPDAVIIFSHCCDIVGLFLEEGTDSAVNDKTQIVLLSKLYDTFIIREADTNIDLVRNSGAGYSDRIYTLVATKLLC